MLPLFLVSRPAGLVAYSAVLVIWAGSEFAYYFRFGGRGRNDQDRWSGPAVIGSLLLSVWLGTLLWRTVPAAEFSGNRSVFLGVGIAVAVAGIALRAYAIRTLGKFFRLRVTTTSDQTVVERGPYRFVRHPSYTGALMTVLGVLLCTSNWLSLACFLIALPGVAYRIKVEEGALAGALGDPYRDYMKRTKRLIPYVL